MRTFSFGWHERATTNTTATSVGVGHQASLLTDLDGKPLIVLTADTGHDATWQPAQDHMATLSTNSLHRVAKTTTHQSLLDDEADSAAASQAIHDVVTAVRTSDRLPPQYGSLTFCGI